MGGEAEFGRSRGLYYIMCIFVEHMGKIEIRRGIKVGDMSNINDWKDALPLLQRGECLTIPPNIFVYPPMLDRVRESVNFATYVEWNHLIGHRIWRTS